MPSAASEECMVRLTNSVLLSAWESFNRKAELSANVANKVNYVLMNIGLVLEGKSPAKMRKIIQDSQVIRTTRNTSHGRGPNITMNKLKRSSSFRGRGTKGQTHDKESDLIYYMKLNYASED